MKEGIAYRPLADMETNGVYFEREEHIETIEVTISEEDICQYSGLRSLSFYEKMNQESK